MVAADGRASIRSRVLAFDAAALLKELSAAVAQQTSSSEACAYVEIKSI